MLLFVEFVVGRDGNVITSLLLRLVRSERRSNIYKISLLLNKIILQPRGGPARFRIIRII